MRDREFDYVDRFIARLGVVGFFLLAYFLPACVSDSFVITIDAGGSDVAVVDANTNDTIEPSDASVPDSNGSPDAPLADTGTVDTGSDACTTESGVTACGRALDAYCANTVSCGYWQSIQACRSWLNVNFMGDFDCSMGKYMKTVCVGPTNQCIADVGAVSCGVIQTKTPRQVTFSCGNFFGQF